MYTSKLSHSSLHYTYSLYIRLILKRLYCCNRMLERLNNKFKKQIISPKHQDPLAKACNEVPKKKRKHIQWKRSYTANIWRYFLACLLLVIRARLSVSFEYRTKRLPPCTNFRINLTPNNSYILRLRLTCKPIKT